MPVVIKLMLVPGSPGGRVASVLVEMEHLVADALQTAFPGQQEKPLVAATRDSKKFGGDYQCNNAMSLFAKLKGKVSAIHSGCCPHPVALCRQTHVKADLVQSVHGVPRLRHMATKHAWSRQTVSR